MAETSPGYRRAHVWAQVIGTNCSSIKSRDFMTELDSVPEAGTKRRKNEAATRLRVFFQQAYCKEQCRDHHGSRSQAKSREYKTAEH